MVFPYYETPSSLVFFARPFLFLLGTLPVFARIIPVLLLIATFVRRTGSVIVLAFLGAMRRGSFVIIVFHGFVVRCNASALIFALSLPCVVIVGVTFLSCASLVGVTFLFFACLLRARIAGRFFLVGVVGGLCLWCGLFGLVLLARGSVWMRAGWGHRVAVRLFVGVVGNDFVYFSCDIVKGVRVGREHASHY